MFKFYLLIGLLVYVYAIVFAMYEYYEEEDFFDLSIAKQIGLTIFTAIGLIIALIIWPVILLASIVFALCDIYKENKFNNLNKEIDELNEDLKKLIEPK